MRKIFKQNTAGFTLIETMVAVAIITIGFVAVLSLVNTSLSYISAIRNRLIAANLAAEGIEVMRNIRDSNWHHGWPWNSWMGVNGDYQVAYNSAYTDYYNGAPLRLNSNGFYNLNDGAITPYVRKISITNISGYEIRVVSEVTWKVRTITYKISAEDHLFNWK